MYFDHDTELADPYRGIPRHRRNALQEQPGKGRHLHKKWPDVVAIKGLQCDIVIEEERQADAWKAQQDVDVITRCKYLWVDGIQFDLINPVLFVLLDGPLYNADVSVTDNVGTFKRVVVCQKSDFEDAFRRTLLSEQLVAEPKREGRQAAITTMAELQGKLAPGRTPQIGAASPGNGTEREREVEERACTKLELTLDAALTRYEPEAQKAGE